MPNTGELHYLGAVFVRPISPTNLMRFFQASKELERAVPAEPGISTISVAYTVATPSFHLGHRPVLDGVRGISIALVLIHHANFINQLSVRFLPGGFLGVDIFFVLSGFLITSILIEEYEKTGKISLRHFYIRRGLRLLPAVASVLLFSAVTGAIVGFGRLGLTPLRVASIAGYFTNWVRAYETPDLWFLAHFWSLAIEEQFYLFWPLLLVILMRSGISRRAILIIVLLLSLASMLWMTVLHSRGSTVLRVYSGSDTRGHTLLIGCLMSLALHWGYVPSWLREEKPLAAVARISVIALATLALLVSSGEPLLYLGGFGLVSLSAAILILWLLSNSSVLGGAFTHPATMWLGKRSYGLYIWHWPIYFLSGSLHRPALAIPLAIVATMIVAALSYRYIESPFLGLKSRYYSRLDSPNL